TGTTNGAVNALGNLIIGYNELRTDTYGLTYGADDKSGSHNLVLGRNHNYPSFGGIILGSLNTAGAEGNFVAGHENFASGTYSSITGGRSNRAGSAPYSTVSGGIGRTASGDGDWAAGSYWQDY
ncbi:MAG: hypothetical protein GY754_28595, partial [bacterium]|nr:hypothetical protein [bacterium]